MTEVAMNARERLQKPQAVLEARGVRDVKFCFSDVRETPLSFLTEDVAVALQAYIDGKVHPLGPLGDSVRQ